MSYLRSAAIAALTVTLCGPVQTMAVEQVGEAVLIKTEVSGKNGPLAVKGPVHRDERIRTSKSGLGEFVFLDGTKLAVGWGSSVVIDKFVYDDSKSVKRLTIKAAKGTFRWISGKSKSTAYEIVTPAGTIGVRGTEFDVHIGPDGTTAVVLLKGRAQFCGANGCQQLKRHCDCVVATPKGGVTGTRRVDRSIFKTLGSTRALPFLSGTQRLSNGFGTMSSNCGLSRTAAQTKDPARNPPQRARTPDPTPPSQPDNPAAPAQQRAQAQQPAQAEQPAQPGAPVQHDTPPSKDPGPREGGEGGRGEGGNGRRG